MAADTKGDRANVDIAIASDIHSGLGIDPGHYCALLFAEAAPDKRAIFSEIREPWMNRISISDHNIAAQLDSGLRTSALLPNQISAAQSEGKKASGWSNRSRSIVSKIPMVLRPEDDFNATITEPGGKTV